MTKWRWLLGFTLWNKEGPTDRGARIWHIFEKEEARTSARQMASGSTLAHLHGEIDKFAGAREGQLTRRALRDLCASLFWSLPLPDDFEPCLAVCPESERANFDLLSLVTDKVIALDDLTEITASCLHQLLDKVAVGLGVCSDCELAAVKAVELVDHFAAAVLARAAVVDSQ